MYKRQVLHQGKVLRDTTPAAMLAEAGVAELEEAFIRLIGKPVAEATA